MTGETGIPGEVAPLVRRILAPNPSPMTYQGTNSYLLGRNRVAVVDPGPNDPKHLEAILAALGPKERITHIFVTHAHLDHSPLARALSAETAAPILGYGSATAGRSPRMQALAASGDVGGGEGLDHDFEPDIRLADGALVSQDSWSIKALHTPGHLGNHMCFAFDDILFTGDLIMGWATSLISPPDGDLRDFLKSCRKVQDHAFGVFLPGHGDPVTTPAERTSDLINHRLLRERQVVDALSHGPQSVSELARSIYTDTDPTLLPAAERNVLAHVLALLEDGRVAAEPEPSIHARFRLL